MISERKAPGVLDTPADAPSPDGSKRARLARLARDAALRVPGVVGTNPGPAGLRFTVSGGERAMGVSCVAVGTGGYAVSLGLACRLVALQAHGDQVRAVVRRAAAVADIAVEAVHVHVVDVEVH